MPEQTINISGQVGNLNLGKQNGTVTNTIAVLASSEGKKKDLAAALQSLVEGVNANATLTDEDKAELLGAC